MIRAVFILVALTLVPVPAAADALHRELGTWPCYWVRGRMMAYNGNPTLRIWPRSTHRLLGVVDGETLNGEHITLPPSLDPVAYGFKNEVWGNFRVCPVEREREGAMRMVVVRDARVLAVRPYGTSYE